MVRAKKHLGQHFLRDLDIAQRIVESLSPSQKKVVEIRPREQVFLPNIWLKETILI